MSRILSIAVVALALALPQNLSAQPVQNGTVRLITLGTRAGQFPAPYRAQNANALIVGDSIYLFDVGDGALRRIAQANLTIRNIAAVFITHLHDDHTSGLPALMSVEWEFHRETAVGIYGPPHTEGLVDAALDFTKFNAATRIGGGTMSRPIETLFAGHDVQPGGEIYRDGNITVTAVENTHFVNLDTNSSALADTKSYSYRVTTPAGVIVFSGDTGPSDALAQLATGADLLVSEITDVDKIIELRKADGSWDTWTPSQQTSLVAHVKDEHLAADAVADIAVKSGVRNLILSHLPPDLDLRDDYLWLADKVKTAGYGGPIFVAQDLMAYDLVPRSGQFPQVIQRNDLREAWQEEK